MIRNDEIGEMREEVRYILEEGCTGDEVTPLFRNEANWIMPRILAFNIGCSRNHQ